ncbi:condensation domain-containing protein [Nocardia brasiliensis]|uniref:condensation domain-containing protein n=1 Tax=Nocardia brasiliensis TaxID=37326 RepID=UPI00366F9DB4
MDQRLVEFHGSRSAVAPATCAQRQLWGAIQQKLPDSAFFNQIYRVGLSMKPTLPDVLSALSAAVGAHESLRTVFVADAAGALSQHVSQSGSFSVHTASVGPSEDPGTVFRAWEARMLQTGYQFEVDLPLRALVVLDREVPVLVAFCVSHLAVDLTSLRVLADELIARLNGHAVPANSRQPVDHALFERSPKGQRLLARSLAYWQRQLADAPPTAIPAQRSGQCATLAMDSRAVALALSTLAARYDISSGAVLLAAAAQLLGRRAGLSRVAFRLLVSNRFAPDLRNAVANLHQEVPATIDVGSPSFAAVARSALKSSMAAYSRGHYDPDLVDELVRQCHAEDAFPACFNDIRESRGGSIADADSICAALDHTVVAPHSFQEAEPFFLMIDGDGSEWIRILLSTDTAAMPPSDAHRFLVDLEQLLVQEARTAQG